MKSYNSRSLKQNAAHEGEFLAAWLSSDGWGYSKKAQRSIASLLEQLLSLKDKQKRKEQEAALVPINAILADYPWVLRALGSRHGRPAFADWPTAPPEDFHWAMRTVVWLARIGLLDRVRRCETCRIWFYAQVPKARFHSDECRQAHHRSTPEYQEKNREYMRTYYRDILSPKTAKHLKGRGGKRNAKKK